MILVSNLPVTSRTPIPQYPAIATEIYIYIHTDGSKEMKKLDHVLTNNLNTNKDQLNDSIYNERLIDTSIFNSSSGTRDPLPVVTVTLRGVNKHRATTVYGTTCLCYSGATNSMINIKHTKFYECMMRSNKV